MAALVVALTGCGAGSGSPDAPDVDSLSRPRESVARPALQPDGPTLRVLTFNVNFGNGQHPANLDVIEEADADLVLLQETTDAIEDAMRHRLSDRYPHMLFRACCRAGGLGILSKGPLLDEDYLEPTIGWFPAWRVVVQTPIGPVQALDVHLRPPMSDDGSWIAGYFSTRDDRRAEIEDLFAHLDPNVPTLVAGDFNENRKGQAIAFLAEQGLVSALPQIDPRAKTWHWNLKVGSLRGQLDHVVYATEDFGLVDARVLGGGESDHFAVLVELQSARAASGIGAR